MSDNTLVESPLFKLFDRLIGASKRRHKGEVEKGVEASVEFEKRRREADTMLALAEKQPGMKGAVEVFDGKLKQVDEAVPEKQPGLLEAAIAELDKAKEGRNERTKDLRTKAKPQLQLYNSVIKALDAPGFPRDRGETLRTEAGMLFEAMFSPRGDLEEIGKRLEGVLSGANNVARVFAERAKDGKLQIEAVRRQLEPIVAVNKTQTAPILGRLVRAEALFSNGEHEAAAQLVESAQSDAKDLVDQGEQAAQEWISLEGEVAGLLKRAETLAASKCPVLAKSAPAPADAVKALTGLDGVGSGKIRPGEAVQRVKAAKAQIEENEGRAEAYETLGEERTQRDLKVQNALKSFKDEAGKKLSAMNRYIDRRDDGERLSQLEPHQSAVAALAEKWKGLLATATTADALDADGLIGQIAAHTQKVASMTVDGGGLANAAAIERMNKAKPQFDKARQECDRQLAVLEPLGSGDYAGLAERLAASVARVAQTADKPGGPETVEGETKALRETLLGAITKAISTAQGEAKKAKEDVAKPMREVEYGFGELEKEFERAGTSWLTKAPEYKGIIDLLRNDKDGVASVLAGTDDVDIIKGLLPSLAELNKRIDQAREAIAGRAPSGGVTLQSLNEAITTDAASLKAKVLTEYLAATTQRLSDQLDVIKGNVGKIAMDKSEQALKAWEQARQTAYGAAGKAEAAYGEFKKLVEAKEKELKTLAGGDFGDAPAYAEDLKKRLAALKTSGKSEGGLVGAQQQLDFISKEIEDAKDPASRKDRNDGAQAVADQAIKDAKRWELEYEDFKATTLGELERKKVGAQMRKDAAELGKQANTNFEKTKDYTTARQMLNAAVAKAKVALAMPEGMETLRKTLVPEALAAWRSAIEAMRGGMAELVQTIDTAEPGAGAEVEKAMTEVRGQFNAGIFDGPCKAFAAPGADEKARRAARETALQEVRRLRALLDGDPRCGALMRNPFMKPFPPIHQISRAVNTIEKTLMLGF